ncbi:virulence factor family protein [Burkholderia multivorans]|uniref:virulence factor family protein n=1 Tax=Burkholderia multivorans TaxID=87883 RepID=UPI001C20FBD8|nr:AcvB/VirJ family lysyl-phosphatidylglycerol hydrolase [Burkholderia multivorans]MBU9220616.1 virulence factor family protein [Burkholderia multivorans]MBU9417069.1 virulence factor family protein [Burkholderia multivorans]
MMSKKGIARAAIACAGWMLAGAALAAQPVATKTETVPGGRYGPVTVTKPNGPLRGFVVLFSREAGWTAADQQAADALAKAGAMTVGVDAERYAKTLAAKAETCHHLDGDAEAVSHQLERLAQSSRYYTPIVAGVGQGGAIAKQILAMAPENTIAGVVAVAPAAKLDPRFKPCPPDPTIVRRAMPGFVDMAPAGDTAKLVSLVAAHLHDDGSADEQDVSDLPLVELPANGGSERLAIVISGDGGWRDLDKTIAEALQRDGVSVVGIDSLRYFWSEKPPAQTSRDLARVMRTYMKRWHASRVALVGYSFGADVMPFAYNRLPADLRDKVQVMSLLGFAPAADFQIRVTGWLGMPASEHALKVAPEIAKVPPQIVQCFYGAQEQDTMCPALANTGVDVIRTGGDHHFGRDYIALEKKILRAFERPVAAR